MRGDIRGALTHHSIRMALFTRIFSHIKPISYNINGWIYLTESWWCGGIRWETQAIACGNSQSVVVCVWAFFSASLCDTKCIRCHLMQWASDVRSGLTNSMCLSVRHANPKQMGGNRADSSHSGWRRSSFLAARSKMRFAYPHLKNHHMSHLKKKLNHWTSFYRSIARSLEGGQPLCTQRCTEGVGSAYMMKSKVNMVLFARNSCFWKMPEHFLSPVKIQFLSFFFFVVWCLLILFLS